MNRSNFNQTGGFPFKTERLQELQNAFSIFNSLGSLAGNFTIISGCESTETHVTDGHVFINGELLEFRQAFGSEDSTVIIVEEPVNRSFENGVIKEVHNIRYATFGNADDSWLWSSFTRPMQTKNIAAALFQKEEKSVVTALAAQVTNLAATVAGLNIPQIQITNDSQIVSSFTTLGDYSSDFTKNYVDVLPPAGYTMAHLKGVLPSIALMHYAGEVDDNDTTWCKWQVQSDKIRIICGNREQRAAPTVSYMIIWIK